MPGSYFVIQSCWNNLALFSGHFFSWFGKKTGEEAVQSIFLFKNLSVCNDMVNMRVEVSDIWGWFFLCVPSILKRIRVVLRRQHKYITNLEDHFTNWLNSLGPLRLSWVSGFILGALGHPTPQTTAGTLKNTGIFCKRRLRTWKLIHFFSYPVILGSIHNVDLGDRHIGWLHGAKSKKKPVILGERWWWSGHQKWCIFLLGKELTPESSQITG